MRAHDPIAADLQELIALLAARLVEVSRRGLRAKLRRLVRAVRATDLNAGDIALLTLAVLLGLRVTGGGVRR